MTSNTQKKWYEGLTVEEIEAVFAERERRNYAEIVAPILPEMSQTECAVCYVRDEDGGCDCRVIKCGECGTEGKKYNHTLCDDGVLRCDVCVEEDEEDEEDEHVHKVCKVCDECITCGGCGCDDEEDEEDEEDEDVDSRDAPNIYPYKKCSECGERSSCGQYKEEDWVCEGCDTEY